MSDLGYILLCLVGLLGYAALLFRVLQRRLPPPTATGTPAGRASAHARWRH